MVPHSALSPGNERENGRSQNRHYYYDLMQGVPKLSQIALTAMVIVASPIEREMNGRAATLRFRQRSALVTVETSEGPCGVSDGSQKGPK